ncbi:MAG: hypothetical protein FWG50_05065 [Kiritimatiellaeota bacterium]|nr:hypothetical protein [Kiritimatiellota bacterium]
MKRLTTCCFLLLAGLNVFFARFLPLAAARYGSVMRDLLLGGTPLPSWTGLVFQYSWWPWAGVAVCAAGAVPSLRGKRRDNALKNLLIVFLIAEFLVMFVTLVSCKIQISRWRARQGIPLARRAANGAGIRNVSNGSRGRSPSIVKSVFYRTLVAYHLPLIGFELGTLSESL